MILCKMYHCYQTPKNRTIIQHFWIKGTEVRVFSRVCSGNFPTGKLQAPVFSYLWHSKMVIAFKRFKHRVLVRLDVTNDTSFAFMVLK